MSDLPKILVISEYRGHQIHTMKPEAEVLIALANLGFEIVLMTNGDSKYIPRFENNGVRVIRFYPRSKFNAQDIGVIRKELLANQYDILYAIIDNRAVTAGLIAARGIAIKNVLYRGVSANLAWYDPTSYMKHLNPRVDKIVCNGSAVQEYFHSQLFFDTSKTEVILKGHDLGWYDDVSTADLTVFGIDESAFVISCAVNNRPKMKGLQYLLKATYLWPAEYNIHLLLMGLNTETKENVDISRASPNSERIHFTGPISDPRGIVAASNAAILPSVKDEAATRFVQEAMSMGIAPIITDIPGNRDLVIHNENGLVVPIRDPKSIAEAVLKLYHNPELCKRLGQASKERIRTTLSHDATVRKTADLFIGLTKR